ncbi:hypothetical protein CALCODRAFT_509025 [Calocera cornea HHB12733]|uniref:Uncharacterized protein n=1 Tax=Calocera cornea HHB12733 TaxID=1353952 RepID=A0A165FQ24_9BASI|nr:hypothetical protein CALCODRAFT_509025 [Calocera cornea HHB12733]
MEIIFDVGGGKTQSYWTSGGYTAVVGAPTTITDRSLPNALPDTPRSIAASSDSLGLVEVPAHSVPAIAMKNGTGTAPAPDTCTSSAYASTTGQSLFPKTTAIPHGDDASTERPDLHSQSRMDTTSSTIDVDASISVKGPSPVSINTAESSKGKGKAPKPHPVSSTKSTSDDSHMTNLSFPSYSTSASSSSSHNYPGYLSTRGPHWYPIQPLTMRPVMSAGEHQPTAFRSTDTISNLSVFTQKSATQLTTSGPSPNPSRPVIDEQAPRASADLASTLSRAEALTTPNTMLNFKTLEKVKPPLKAGGEHVAVLSASLASRDSVDHQYLPEVLHNLVKDLFGKPDHEAFQRLYRRLTSTYYEESPASWYIRVPEVLGGGEAADRMLHEMRRVKLNWLEMKLQETTRKSHE